MYKKFYDVYSNNKFFTFVVLIALIIFMLFCFKMQNEYQTKVNNTNLKELAQSLEKCQSEGHSDLNNCKYIKPLKRDYKIISGNIIVFMISGAIATLIIHFSDKYRFSAREFRKFLFIFIYVIVILLVYIVLFSSFLWINNINSSDITDDEYYYFLYSALINMVGSLTVAMLLNSLLSVIKPISLKKQINKINDDLPRIKLLFDELNENTMSFNKNFSLIEIIKLLENHNKSLHRATMNNNRLIKSIQIRHKEIYGIIKDVKTLNKTFLIEDVNLYNTHLDINYFIDKAKRKEAKSRLYTKDIIGKLEKNKEYLEQIDDATEKIENLYNTNEIKR